MAVSALVAVKRCLDSSARLRLLADGSGVDALSGKLTMNPYCEVALEAALQAKKEGKLSSIHAVTVGGAGAADVLRTALALGADRATHIVHSAPDDQLAVARLLAALITREAVPPELVLLGKLAADTDAGVTGPLLASLLGWPLATAVTRMELDSTHVQVVHEADEGAAALQLGLPAVLTADLRLAQPRFASLAATLKAKKVAILEVPAAELVGGLAAQWSTVRVRELPARPPARHVHDAAELLAVLRERGAIP